MNPLAKDEGTEDMITPQDGNRRVEDDMSAPVGGVRLNNFYT